MRKTLSKLTRKGRNNSTSTPVDRRPSNGFADAAGKLSITSKDVVIAIMGLTGTGKSTFIEHLTQSGVRIGHNLRSCTVDVGVHQFTYRNGQRIYLIDTPGFDDTTRSDTEVLKDVAYFLGAAYSKDIKLAGIIYLHRITDRRMTGSALKNLHMFKALCGSTSLSNVVLATTMWDTLVDEESISEGEKKERELRKERDFWGDMVKMGSKMFRHYGTEASALNIVDYIMRLKGSVVLDIQRQMVDDGQTLDETTAGQEVQRELLATKKKYDEEIRETKKSMKEAIEAGNREMADRLKEMEAASQKKLDDANRQTQELKQNFDKIKKEGDARMQKLLDEQRAESQRNKELAELRAVEVAELAAKQREYEARIEEEKQNNANKDAEWTARITQMNVEAENLRRNREAKQREMAEAQAQQMNNDKNLSIFKMVLGTGMAVASAVFMNPALAGASTALLGSASRTTHYVKAG